MLFLQLVALMGLLPNLASATGEAIMVEVKYLPSMLNQECISFL